MTFYRRHTNQESGLPGGRRHGHFSQMWQFTQIYCRGKFVAVSGRKVAVKVPKMLKCGRRKSFLKISNKTDRNITTSNKYARFYKLFCLKFAVRRSLEVLLHKESPCKVHFLF
jgi:hypothetical protein